MFTYLNTSTLSLKKNKKKRKIIIINRGCKNIKEPDNIILISEMRVE